MIEPINVKQVAMVKLLPNSVATLEEVLPWPFI